MVEMKNIVGPMRLPFLILTPACVALGFGTAFWTQGYVAPFHVIMVLVGAVSAHIIEHPTSGPNELWLPRSGDRSRAKEAEYML